MTLYTELVASEPGEMTPLFGTKSARCRRLSELSAKVALVVFLVCGVSIGGYLMHMQNTVHVTETFDLVTRDTWHANTAISRGLPLDRFASRITHLVVFHTRGPQCSHLAQCARILQEMQLAANQSTGTDIPYNFLIGGDGQTYQARGWNHQPGVAEVPANTTLTVAFMGDYSEQSPAELMLREADALLHIAEDQGRLAANWLAYGVRYLAEGQLSGLALFRALAKRWPRWDGLIDVV